MRLTGSTFDVETKSSDMASSRALPGPSHRRLDAHLLESSREREQHVLDAVDLVRESLEFPGVVAVALSSPSGDELPVTSL